MPIPARFAVAAALILTAAHPAQLAAQDGPAKPGDRVLLRIVRDSVLADTLHIDANGMVVLALAGDVRLGGVPGNAVQDTIRARLARFMNPTAVQATLLRRVRLMGDVAKPGVYYLDRTFTLRDAIANAGAVGELGDPVRATLERGGARTVLADWHTDAESLKALESGDQLTVARLPWYRRNAIALATTAASVLATIIITLSR